jgi:hypothetical protein
LKGLLANKVFFLIWKCSSLYETNARRRRIAVGFSNNSSNEDFEKGGAKIP